MNRSRGFTLLEVLMAIAILGLGLSVLLGAQTGLFASANRAERISVATGLGRCRMSEIELDLLQKGFPLIDQESEGDCCMEQGTEGFDCSWKIQRIELPDAMLTDGDAGVDPAESLDPNGMGPMSALLSLEQTGGAALGEQADLGALATQFSGAMGGSDGLAGMLMGFIYPSLKPMLEASIRKVIVSVRWREGIRQRTLDITQYITDPKQAAAASEEASTALSGMSGIVPGATGTETGTGTGTGNPNPTPAAGQPK